MKKQLTLAFFIQGDKILLGLKKKGFGNGRFNGFGGKVEPHETIEEATKREAFEECQLEILKLEKRAIHEFSFASGGDILEVHTFLVTSWQGEPVETDEMQPKWFSIDSIPYDHMWPDDVYWLPLFLQGKKIRTRFFFGEGDKVLKQEINEVTEIE